MKAFRGVPASPGIAIGKAFLYSDDDLLVPEYAVETHEVEPEMERYRAAVARAVADLEQLKARSVGGHEFVEAHLLMLQDPEIESKVDVRIRRLPKNVECVLKIVVDDLIA